MNAQKVFRKGFGRVLHGKSNVRTPLRVTKGISRTLPSRTTRVNCILVGIVVVK